MSVIVHAGMLGVVLVASCTDCGATWEAPERGSIRHSYEAFCAQHRHAADQQPRATSP
jgi:hypothetical protein